MAYAASPSWVRPDDTLPEQFDIELDNGRIVTIFVEYSWRPSYCPHCKLYGHIPDKCPSMVRIPKSSPKNLRQAPTDKPSTSGANQVKKGGMSNQGKWMAAKKITVPTPQKSNKPESSNTFKVLDNLDSNLSEDISHFISSLTNKDVGKTSEIPTPPFPPDDNVDLEH